MLWYCSSSMAMAIIMLLLMRARFAYNLSIFDKVIATSVFDADYLLTSHPYSALECGLIFVDPFYQIN